MLSGSAYSANWDIKPSITLREIYSDNIALEDEQKNDDWVTDISPRVLITADGNRLDLQFDYSLQNLIYSNDSDRNNSNHRLNTSLKTELVEDLLFFDARARVSQQLVDIREGLSTDRISGSQNAEDVYGYSLSPYFTPKLGDYLSAEIRYTYDYVDSEDDNNINSFSDDSEGDHFSVKLENGPELANLFWNVSYDSREVDYGDGDRTDTERLRVTAGYWLTRYWAVELISNDENNEFIGDRGDNDPDDSYYGAGFRWRPSETFNLSLAYNDRTDPRRDEDDSFVSGKLEWNPTPRTDLKAEFGNRFFGETYDFSFSHRMRRSSWQLSYSEDIGDFRQSFLDFGTTGSLVCPLGVTDFQQCRIFDQNQPPGIGEQVIGSRDQLPSITSDTYISKTLRASWSIKGGRNIITFNVSRERREFIGDNEEEKDLDINVSWSYQLAPRSLSVISLRHGQEKFEEGEEYDDYTASWTLSTLVGAKSKLALQLYHATRDAGMRFNNYDENRATLSFQHDF